MNDKKVSLEYDIEKDKLYIIRRRVRIAGAW